MCIYIYIYIYIYVYVYPYMNVCLGKIIDSKKRLEAACYTALLPSWQYSELLITTVNVTFKTG